MWPGKNSFIACCMNNKINEEFWRRQGSRLITALKKSRLIPPWMRLREPINRVLCCLAKGSQNQLFSLCSASLWELNSQHKPPLAGDFLFHKVESDFIYLWAEAVMQLHQRSSPSLFWNFRFPLLADSRFSPSFSGLLPPPSNQLSW